MMHNRMLWAVLSVVFGGLQAWDSGILQAGSTAAWLVGIGVLLPAIALATTANWTAWIAALVAGAVLLVAGRMSSSVSLNAVHIGLLVPAMYVLFVHRLEGRLHAQR
jgi:hypothetical protein